MQTRTGSIAFDNTAGNARFSRRSAIGVSHSLWVAGPYLKLLATCAAIVCVGFSGIPTASPAFAVEPVDFVRDVRPIFEKHCYECHGAAKQKSGLRLDIREAAFKGGDGHGPAVVSQNPSDSPLLELVRSSNKNERMPPMGDPLTAEQIDILRRWIEEGAAWPVGVDRARLEDRRDHWSFKPLREFDGPQSIDGFIARKLSERGLSASPPAEPETWLRRVSLDLTGLPPSPEEVADFRVRVVQATDDNQLEQTYAAEVDRLLTSDRYGERWGQHWLDVVRYADTHGFEVNTERPHAWQYRDYVIRAFNKDVPYDRFIREQIVGDALGEDAATGFLVTASVLLPDQIGKDAPSIRLARQDALDEIVNNISQTFLGLSVGCARCHDHKFDPVSARDYYAMQAFVAGVEYGDREVRSPEADSRRQATVPLRSRLGEIDALLARLVPSARPGFILRETNADQNVERFATVEARFVRFAMHDANRHPDLGLIEPCIDEFEIFTDEPQPRNLALASLGTMVTASGSQTSSEHQLEHVNDGQYGNSKSWMSNEPGRGWLLFELPTDARISKVIWGRDRNGHFRDRLPTAFTLEAGLTLDSLQPLVTILPPRPMVAVGTINVDRFQPVLTRRLRFTILKTNSLEPCLDELEVFNTSGENIALASHGTNYTTSGDTVVADRHEPAFINDGRYGNERSWMSNELGRGWIEYEFPEAQQIDRVVWSRDRQGKFDDRSPIEYRIEVERNTGLQLVADSSDRRPYEEGAAREPETSFTGLSPEETAIAKKLSAEKANLLTQIREAEAGQLAFAGNFRSPDEIRLLSRGDPEQPLDPVQPAVIASLGDLKLAATESEQARRVALAKWIANPQNPLTARVMINRIWQGHFGTGLVGTPSDLGRSGLPPTHPELLDWLAMEFIRSGWSIKQMHRLIVLSRTYRQSSLVQAAAAEQDAEATLLWRFPSRRLEAESIRDAMLSVSGLLNLQMYGRGFDLFDKRGGLSGFKPVETLSSQNQRRMIYAHKVRRESEAVFGAFDCPDAGQSAAVRRMSTTPIQALNLFNSRFTLQTSQAFAARVERESTPDVMNQVRRAYALALGRLPTSEELSDAAPVVREHGLPVLCRALFNSNEFLFIP